MRSLLFMILVLFIVGCTKDLTADEYQELKQGIVAHDLEKVGIKITQAINVLPSQEYTEQNLNALAIALSGECGLFAKVLCFSCIETLPEQSEIRVSFEYSGTVVNKTIDISYAPDNKMRFVNLHE